jgi:hypothetical protein
VFLRRSGPLALARPMLSFNNFGFYFGNNAPRLLLDRIAEGANFFRRAPVL